MRIPSSEEARLLYQNKPATKDDIKTILEKLSKIQEILEAQKMETIYKKEVPKVYDTKYYDDDPKPLYKNAEDFEMRTGYDSDFYDPNPKCPEKW